MTMSDARRAAQAAPAPTAAPTAAPVGMAQGTSGQRAFFPRLDGLRGIAILLVLVEHFTYNDWLRGWHPGAVGVRTFFVLSGFLITAILLQDRDSAAAPARIAARFFRNRVLRLAPAFMTAVALTAALGVADMRADWPWHVTYLSNLQVALDGRWTGAGHFWTLALEEQFYLLWFPVVIVLPRRALPAVMLGCLLLAPLFRLQIALGASPFLDVLLPAQADALAAGGLLAWAMRQGVSLARVLALLGDARLCWGLIAAVAVLSAPVPPGIAWPAVVGWVLLPCVTIAAALSVIRRATVPDAGMAVLAWPWLRHVGRISYGLYVFHYLVPPTLYDLVPAMAALAEGPGKLLRLLIWLALSFLLAELSWRWLERPALRLKAVAVRGA